MGGFYILFFFVLVIVSAGFCFLFISSISFVYAFWTRKFVNRLPIFLSVYTRRTNDCGMDIKPKFYKNENRKS